MSYNQYQAVFFACRSMLAKNRPGNEARLVTSTEVSLSHYSAVTVGPNLAVPHDPHSLKGKKETSMM